MSAKCSVSYRTINMFVFHGVIRNVLTLKCLMLSYLNNNNKTFIQSYCSEFSPNYQLI